VYKIIHDLRHPTQALVDGLTNLVDEANSFQKASEDFLSKSLKYKGNSRIQKATKLLKDFINKTKSQQKKLKPSRKNNSEKAIKFKELTLNNHT